MDRRAAPKLVAHFEAAHDAYVYRGGLPPQDRPEIEANYKGTRERLIEELTKK